jgi:formylglycine-generating enzyme required for sulfatase activity
MNNSTFGDVFMPRRFVNRFECSVVSIILFFQFSAFANNLNISTPQMTGQNSSGKYVFVKFDISWENSWRKTSEPSNWDAAWIFIKYRIGTGTWQHATVHSSGHTAPSGSTITPSQDGKGVFVYRSATGNGSVNYSGMKIRWDYGTDGIADTSHVIVKVMGVEMVYVPQGNYDLGSGGQESGTFTDGSWDGGNTIPFSVTSENAIPVGQSTGKLWAMNDRDGDDIGPATSIPANFPKGYKSFFCMKYSITQEQYIDFLNSLTYAQQAERTEIPPNSPARTKAMMIASLPKDRNAIQIQVPGTSSSVPAVYGCDLDSNGTFNQANDGQNITCNWLSWGDGTAYCDWAALRPMSELEFEKACRGPLPVFQYERAYGNTVLGHLQNILNGGQANEAYVSAAAPLEHAWNDSIGGASNISAGGYAGFFDYPIRAGIYATSISDRVQSGATYYGIMEMSGNLWERTVTVGNIEGRNFSGSHGDGMLNTSGDQTGNSDWPGPDALGSGFRGGNFSYDSDWAMTSDRDLATRTVALRYETRSQNYNGYSISGYRGTFGFRGVRTAP